LYRKTILGNGIRVVTEHIPYVRSVTIGFWFRTGSRDEGAENNGVSHLIEHMVFKGTTTPRARPALIVVPDRDKPGITASA
jgi:predicted Zn-dependent peptidase